MITTYIYRAIALLLFLFTAYDMYREDAPSLKVNACMVLVPLLLRVLMIK